MEPWLPEPLEYDQERQVEVAESVSLAFLVLLERLSPVERAVFLLHEVFGYPYEIAPIVGKREATCRQLVRRARERIGVGRPRYRAPTDAGERVAVAFLRACQNGDLPDLLALLTEDVELITDGGGQVAAARVPVRRIDLVAQFLLGIVRQAPPGWTAVPRTVNGAAGLTVHHADGRPLAVFGLEVTGSQITAIRIINNPAKLARVPRSEPDPHVHD